MSSSWPTEHLRGDSMLRWFLGDWALLAVSYAGGFTLADLIVPDNAPLQLLSIALQIGLASVIALPANVLYFLAVPCPRHLLVDPLGVEIDFGLRRKRYAWHEVHLRAKDAYFFGDWGGIPTRVALNPFQRVRLGDWMRVYAPG